MSKLNVANRVGRWIAGVAGLVAFASVACATETLIDRTCSGACTGTVSCEGDELGCCCKSAHQTGAVFACTCVAPGKCANSTHRICE